MQQHCLAWIYLDTKDMRLMTIFSWMFTIVCCLVVGLGLGFGVRISVWPVSGYLYNFRLSMSHSHVARHNFEECIWPESDVSDLEFVEIHFCICIRNRLNTRLGQGSIWWVYSFCILCLPTRRGHNTSLCVECEYAERMEIASDSTQHRNND